MAGAGARAGRDASGVVPLVPATGELDWTGAGARALGPDAAARHRRGLQRARHHQRRRAGLRPGARGRRAHLRGRRALRAPRAGRRPRRSAATSSPARPTSSTGPHVGVLYGRRERLEALDVPKLAPGAEQHAGAARDRHAQSRGHRRAPAPRSTSSRRSPRGARPGASACARASARCTSAGRTCSSGCGRGWAGSAGVRCSGRRRAAPRTPTVAFTRGRPDQRRGRDGSSRAEGVFVSQRRFLRDDGGRAAGSRAGRAWCAPDARATRRARRSTGWSPACARSPADRASGGRQPVARATDGSSAACAARAPAPMPASASRARQLRWPIFRPGLGSVLPYRCSRTPGRRSASAQRGSPRAQRSPRRLIMATGVSRRGLAEREAAERAQLLLELVHGAGVHRVVPAVVRPRRHLVDEEPAAVGDEQLDAQHADVRPCARPRRSPASRASCASRSRHLGRHDGRLEDAVAVAVLARRERGDGAVRPPREHHRQLGLERQPLLQHARHAAEALECRQRRVRVGRPVAWPLPS